MNLGRQMPEYHNHLLAVAIVIHEWLQFGCSREQRNLRVQFMASALILKAVHGLVQAQLTFSFMIRKDMFHNENVELWKMAQLWCRPTLRPPMSQDMSISYVIFWALLFEPGFTVDISEGRLLHAMLNLLVSGSTPGLFLLCELYRA